jgi:poly-beta-1,6-N-acetyl-D-glucosamine synthase
MMTLQETYVLLLSLSLTGYGFFICAFTIGLIMVLKDKQPHKRDSRKTVSVIIPVRNEAGNILHILEEMLGQDYPSDRMEVIVADDHSEDATMELAAAFSRNHPDFSLVISAVDQPGMGGFGKKHTINRAANMAKGEILLLTDADTGRGPGWVSSMAACFGSSRIQMVLGPVCYANERNLLQEIQSMEFLGLMGTTAGSARLGFPVMCNGANLAYRRDVFLNTGGFSRNLKYGSGDDQFMLSAVRKRYGKGSVVFNPDQSAFIRTEPEATLHGFFSQRIRWVSKSPAYRDPAVIIVGMVTWFTHFLLLSGILLGCCFTKLLYISLILWLAKILLEFPMVRIMSRFFRKDKLSRYYLIAQVFQLVYVPLAGLLGLVLPYSWKGRTSR